MSTDITMSQRQSAPTSATGPEPDVLASPLAYLTVGIPTLLLACVGLVQNIRHFNSSSHHSGVRA
jgi:hypothetical protein